MISVVISIGSNCGDRKASVREALEWLQHLMMQTKCSDIYETPCVGKTGTPYINAVISGYYDGDAFQLEDILKDREREMGRNEECRKKGEVPIDLDLVVCDGTIYKPWDYRQKFFQQGFLSISKP